MLEVRKRGAPGWRESSRDTYFVFGEVRGAENRCHSSFPAVKAGLMRRNPQEARGSSNLDAARVSTAFAKQRIGDST